MKFGKTHIVSMSVALTATLMLVGCKPTEANYRAAYDSAKAKREAAAAEQMRPASGLLSDDGPQRRIIEGDTLFVDHVALRLEDSTKPPGRWAVAVGKFKMDTNARAGAAALRDAGWPGALHAKGQGGYHYTVPATTTSLDSARIISRQFVKRNPGYPYVGLPGSPVLIAF